MKKRLSNNELCWLSMWPEKKKSLQNNYSPPPGHHFPLSLNSSLFLTSKTLISHVGTNPTFEMRKVLRWSRSRAQSRVVHVDWADGVSGWSPVSLFSTKSPEGFFHGSGVCWGPTGFSWQPPRRPSGPSSCQGEENTLSGHTVTGADVVVGVHHSFHFLRYAIDSLGGWH